MWERRESHGLSWEKPRQWAVRLEVSGRDTPGLGRREAHQGSKRLPHVERQTEGHREHWRIRDRLPEGKTNTAEFQRDLEVK